MPPLGRGGALAGEGRGARRRRLALARSAVRVRLATDRSRIERRVRVAAARALVAERDARRVRAPVRPGRARAAGEGCDGGCIWKRVGNRWRRDTANERAGRKGDSALALRSTHTQRQPMTLHGREVRGSIPRAPIISSPPALTSPRARA